MSRLLRAAEVVIGSGRKTLEEPATVTVGANVANQPSAGQLAQPQISSDSERLRHQVSELEHANAKQARKLEALEPAAFERGMAEGLVIGNANAKRDHEDQMEALRIGMREALEGFHLQLRAIETLALDLTHVSLERIFGDSALHSTLVAETTRHHLSQVATNSAIGVRVSADDFPDSERLHEAFGAPTEHPTLSVQTDPQLPSGTCLIKLTLGQLDASLPLQKANVITALNKLRPDE